MFKKKLLIECKNTEKNSTVKNFNFIWILNDNFQ